MITIKKTIPLILAFLLGVVITYLIMSLIQARGDVADLREQVVHSRNLIVQAPVEKPAKEKHWMDEMIEKNAAETQQRIKNQQAEGDAFRNKFKQIVE